MKHTIVALMLLVTTPVVAGDIDPTIWCPKWENLIAEVDVAANDVLAAIAQTKLDMETHQATVREMEMWMRLQTHVKYEKGYMESISKWDVAKKAHRKLRNLNLYRSVRYDQKLDKINVLKSHGRKHCL